MKRRELSQKEGPGEETSGKGPKEDSRGVPHKSSKSRRRSKFLFYLKVIFASLVLVYISIPFVIRLFPALLGKVVYLNMVKFPLFVDLSNPGELINHTTNFYLTTEEGVTIGVWHTVPASRGEEARGRNQRWFEESLADANPIIIYLHGNGGTRALDHRVQLMKVLSKAGFHVLALDYRGFGDSTGVPSEAGVTHDAIFLYEWVKERSYRNPVCIWGHSLGTGIATNAAIKLQEKGNEPEAVILEAPYTNIRNAGAYHPFGKVYHVYPGFEYFFLDTFALSSHVFPNDENVRVMTSALLILHAEDDDIVPVSMGKELYEIALVADNSRKVKLVLYAPKLGYKHEDIYKDPKLSGKLWAFLTNI